jgi:hypothetical protein
VTSHRQRTARRSFSRAELEELGRQLAPAYKAGFQLRIRCGKCPNRRVLDELAIAWEPQRDRYSLNTMLPTSSRPGSAFVRVSGTADLDGNLLPGGITRPSVTRLKGAYGRPTTRPDGHDVWIYECHRRCGAVYEFNEGRLIEAFLSLFAKGRTELIAGVDL